MGEKKHKYLTVAPFECVWREELRFKEAGRGCVAFEAFAQNDVTLVFREHVGSQHYHYKMDKSPNYTVILGSHRNRRSKIEVDGKTVVDVVGIGLCNSLAFQSYWISVFDGLISVGKGRHPFQNLVFQWLDSKRVCNVQFVGLSSWDKHVGYRNVNILSLTQNHNCLRSHVEYKDYEGDYAEDWEQEDGADGFDEWGLANFLESWDLADMFFVVHDGRKVPAHKVILGASGVFDFSSSEKDIISLPSIKYPVLHAFLEYIYTGRTQVIEPHLCSLCDLCKQFQVHQLVKQCEEIIDCFRTKRISYDSAKKVELSFIGSHDMHHGIFPFELPVNHQRLHQFFMISEYSDIQIYITDHGLVASSHKIILSSWSAPFAKMFTNGMIESYSSEIILGDIPVEAFQAMLQFMYSGKIDYKGKTDIHTLLVQLLLLADQFRVASLHRECCKSLLDCLSEDSVCYILQVVASLPSCKLLEEACQRNFSMHFDYCTTASIEFELLEEKTFANILQHPDLTVTSEERVLDAILVWCMQANEVCSWETVDELLKSSPPEHLSQERFLAIYNLLPSVRFPLMPPSLLEKLAKSILFRQIPLFKKLVMEAIQYLKIGTGRAEVDLDIRFQHRRSSFKELRYLCDGDDNGVMYFAGTSYGEHLWMNPVLSKKINVVASTPPSRYTDARALVSRTYQGTSFAGPRMEHGRCCAWWMVDLGQDHQLMCNYYTLRQDGSSAYIRSWALQGSSHGENWTDMRVHENDQTICRPGQFSSWPVHGNAALLPFRFFRIILTSPTADLSNPWNLCICSMELYGFFR